MSIYLTLKKMTIFNIINFIIYKNENFITGKEALWLRLFSKKQTNEQTQNDSKLIKYFLHNHFLTFGRFAQENMLNCKMLFSDSGSNRSV